MDRGSWSLRIEGLVHHPTTLTFDELLRYPRTEITAVHQCSGSPFDPAVPTRRVGTATWAGARLADVLADCRPMPQARYIWSYGADGGTFAGAAVDSYCKDLPLSRVDADVLLCYEVNGEDLPAEHGFPVRLLIPGFYGTNSVKWLTTITLADRRAPGPFTAQWYQDPPAAGSEDPHPVWSLAPESLIVAPAAGQSLHRDAEVAIWGWAWADGGVSQVDVGIGGSWHAAEVEGCRGWQWQRFSTAWTPSQPGTVEVAARATSSLGQVQPTSGHRNAVHSVLVDVRDEEPWT